MSALLTRSGSRWVRPLLEEMEPRLAPATRVWSGGGPDTNWSTAANWGTTGVPASRDDVEFPATTFTTSNNNLTDLALSSITFTTGIGYTLTGNSVNVFGRVAANNTSASNRVNFDISTVQTMPIDVATGGQLVLAGVLSGQVSLLKGGAGELVLGGNNTFTGGLSLSAGALAVASDTALGTGAFTVSGGTTLRAEGSARTVANDYSLGTTAAVVLTGSSALTLSGIGTLAGASITLNVTATAAITLGGAVRPSSTSSTLVKLGSGTLALGGTNTYGPTTVSAGTLLVNGSQSGNPVTVNTGATLGGTGNVGGITSTGGTVSPGVSPGILTSSGVTFDTASTFRVELNGTTVGTGHDQLEVKGAANLGGSTLSIVLGYPAVANDSFTILQVSGGLSGTFNGLADGAFFVHNGKPFRINYSSTAVTLTRVQGTTATALTTSATTAVSGQQVTFIATVTFTPAAADPPTGVVVFRDGGTPIGNITLTASGQVSLTTSTLTAGSRSIVAIYSGSADFTNSVSAPVIVVITKGQTKTTMTPSDNPIQLGNPVLLRVQVDPVPPTTGTPSGTVRFFRYPDGRPDQAVSIGQATLINGAAQFAISGLPPGCYNLNARYVGDSGFLESTSSELRLGVAASDNQSFILAIYRDILERPADGTGFSFWTSRLNQGVSRAVVATAFWNSAEHRGLQVDNLYRELLGRAPEPAGRAAWVNGLANGLTEVELAALILGSAEYAARHASATAFVNGLYADVLGRTPDAAGAAFWTQIVQSGVRNRAATAYYFLSGREAYLNALDDYYRHYLGRAADAAGQAGLLAFMEAGAGPVDIVAIFLSSQEYLQRVRIAAC